MCCLTKEEADAWCAAVIWPRDPKNPPKKVFGISAGIPANFTQSFWLSGALASCLNEFNSCLLNVTTWGVWSSSENLHLFYRLRETYGERRLLDEAPGHLFQKFERPELVSFIQLAVLFGWDFHLHPSPSFIRGFVSHDEWFELYATDERWLEEFISVLKNADMKFKSFQRSIIQDNRHRK
jgi:hypothetical protein